MNSCIFYYITLTKIINAVKHVLLMLVHVNSQIMLIAR